jgi:hypothetical protein
VRQGPRRRRSEKGYKPAGFDVFSDMIPRERCVVTCSATMRRADQWLSDGSGGGKAGMQQPRPSRDDLAEVKPKHYNMNRMKENW